MPHTRSAKKRVRQIEKKLERNRWVKKGIKNQIKAFHKAVESGTTEELKTQFVQCVKKLDKAGVRRVIHPNKAARQKSQLARVLNQKLGNQTSST